MIVSLRNYLDIILPRIERAELEGNRQEAARLLRLLSSVALEQADKLYPVSEGAQTMSGESKAEKIVAGINDATEVLGTLVPSIAAIGGMVRLIATVVRPTAAQQAQAFDAAIAEFDAAKAGLDAAIAGFEAAKAAAAAKAAEG